MFGRKERSTDYALNGGAAPTTFALGLVAGLDLSFYVEEDNQLVELMAKVTYTNTVAERTDLTIFVDGADVMAPATNGIAGLTPTNVGANTLVASRMVLGLSKGQHVAQVRMKAPTGVVTAMGTVIPAELYALRLSHNAVLGHGVDSKALLTQ